MPSKTPTKKPVCSPSLSEFKKFARRGNLIPVFREILADLETPVSAFMKIDNGRYSYLLESIEGGEKWARYSILGSDPSLVIRGSLKELELIRGRSITRIRVKKDPLETLKTIMSDYRPVEVEGMPRFFGGAVGYLGYDLVRGFEKLPDEGRRGIDIPLVSFMMTDTLLIFDNVAQKIKVVANVHLEGKESKTSAGLEKAYRQAVLKIEGIIARLRKPLPPGKRTGDRRGKPLRVTSNMKQADYEKMVRRAKDFIVDGDIFQVVLSQRFEMKPKAAPFDVYRTLRLINPSPYMYYLNFDGLQMAGSSPEILVRSENGRIEVRPIAGTRPRGKGEEEDQALEQELLADQKERAEHVMLVDLGRNDVGRVSETGTVRMDEMMTVERYSHVMHIVSRVEGTLQKDKDCYDVLRACFPAGTVSGAPKIRAMEIIEELEPTLRGPYAGAVGYFSFTGNMDTCINIRTVLFSKGKAYVQAGAGIVADSIPKREFEETMNKARGMIRAIEMAEQGLD